MKIVYAFPEPLPIERARGVQVAHTVVELAGQGVEVNLAYVPNKIGHPLEFYGLNPAPSLTLTPLSRSLGRGVLRRIHSNRIFLWRLERHLSKVPYDLLFSRHLKLSALFLERHPGVALAYEAHEVFADTARPARRAAQRVMEALVMKNARLVIANSSATAERLCDRYGHRTIEVLGNGVDWPETLPEKDWMHPGRHIVYAGSFFPWKGVTDLVTAAAELSGCRISLLGGRASDVVAPNRGEAERGAELDFRGHVSHFEVARQLHASCIAVLPNRNDPESQFTSPIKLFEYMAAGCAIVASDLPAARSVLNQEDAVWVTPGNPRSLAAGIRSLAESPELAKRLAARVREKARGHTWRARAQRLAELFQQAQTCR